MLAQQRPYEDQGGSQAKRRADRMQVRPFLYEFTAMGTSTGWINRHERVVGRHDDEKRVGPIGNQDQRTEKPEPDTALPPCQYSQDEANDGKRGLHDEAALVRGFPFDKQRSIVEMQPRRLLGEIDVECCAEENRSDGQCEQADDHGD
jgi:hypothetical protein